MDTTFLARTVKNCVVHTAYSELAVLAYIIITRPHLLPLTKVRMSANMATCMLAEYVSTLGDGSRGVQISIGGMRIFLKAGLIRAARIYAYYERKGSIPQSALCGFFSGIANVMSEPYGFNLVQNTTSGNSFVGDTANAFCNIMFTIQNPEQWYGIMRDKVAISILKEAIKPAAEYLGNLISNIDTPTLNICPNNTHVNTHKLKQELPNSDSELVKPCLLHEDHDQMCTKSDYNQNYGQEPSCNGLRGEQQDPQENPIPS